MTRKAAIIGGGAIGGDVDRAATTVENLGARVIAPAEVRARLKPEKRGPVGK